MKQNKCDDVEFFAAYSAMPRWKGGLEAAGAWRAFADMIAERPDLAEDLRRPMFLLIAASRATNKRKNSDVDRPQG